MATRKKAIRRRRSYSFSRPRRRPRMTLPMAVVAGFVPTAVGVWNRRSSGTEISNYLQRGWTGIEPGTGTFNFANLRKGAFPAVAGYFVHMIASKLGVNRALGRARIPLIRI